MNKAIKYRLYPTTEQAVLFAKTFGCCRKVYNLMLSDKIAHFEATGKSLMTTPAQYKDAYPFLKEVDSLALCNEQLHLQSAYGNFFRDKKIGFPKYKSAKHTRRSYTTNNNHGTIALHEKGIRFPKMGVVKAKIHRRPEADWALKSATISQDSDGKFYASVLFVYEAVAAPTAAIRNAIGLDYKSDGLYVDSDGNKAEGHRFYRKSQAKLTKSQRKLKHKVIGSNNYKKHQRKIARIHKHSANQRLDYLHKKSTEIANQYDAVCVESLNMRAMANKGFGNGKATLDNGYGMFARMLEYKLSDRGKHFIRVDKWFPSSQLCSRCGSKQKISIAERTYRCTCGAVMDRDHNAAINILNEGLRMLNAG